MKSIRGATQSQVYKPGDIPARVYACIDLDAFFAQCESRRLGLDDSVPLVALQWKSCWGVNYAARKFGLTSGMNIDEAKKLCPHLVVAHADTLRLGDDSVNQLPFEKDVSEKFREHDRHKEKVSLDLYRFESDKIFSILRKNCPIVEKGSIDEAFLDITSLVNESIMKKDYDNHWIGKFIGGPEFAPETQEELMLMIGTQIIDRIRQEIKQELNYTCSAGISHNKMLSKLGSGLNKPFGQAIMAKRYAEVALKDIAIKKVRNFGRRIANAFEEHGMHKVGEIQALNIDQIQKIVGEDFTARWVYFRSRGYDDEIVEEKDYSNKSILSNKSFGQVTNMLDLEEIEELIVSDLAVRVIRFYEEANLVPHSLNLHYFDVHQKNYRVKSCLLNLKIKKENFKAVMLEKAHEMVKQVQNLIFPCQVLGVSVKNFEKSDMKSYSMDITGFMKKLQAEKSNDSNSKASKANFEIERSAPFATMEDDDSSPNKLDKEEEELYVEKVVCEKCSLSVNKDDYESHRDFHLAEDLDKELNPNKKKYKKKNFDEGTMKTTQATTQTATQASQAEKINMQGVKMYKKNSIKKEELPTNSQIMKIENFFKKK